MMGAMFSASWRQRVALYAVTAIYFVPVRARRDRLFAGAEWIRTVGAACLARKRPIPANFGSPSALRER